MERTITPHDQENGRPQGAAPQTGRANGIRSHSGIRTRQENLFATVFFMLPVDVFRRVVQISPSSFVSGPNGVGGITVDGRISNMDLKVDKKGNTRISMNISGKGINAQLDITLYAGSDNAYVIVSPNFNSQTVRLEGKLVPYGQSRTYEGMSL